MKEQMIDYEKMEWKEVQGYPTGRKIKIFREEGAGTGKTFMLKIEKGCEMLRPCLNTVEQHFVLDGQYESEGRVYKAGTYRLIPKQETRGVLKTSEGATILVICDPESDTLPDDMEETFVNPF